MRTLVESFQKIVQGNLEVFACVNFLKRWLESFPVKESVAES